jgi:hypothetical protein
MTTNASGQNRNRLHRYRKLFAVTLIVVILALCAGGVLLLDHRFPGLVFQPKNETAAQAAAQLILPLKNEAQIKQTAEENQAFFKANQEKLERIAVYLEETEDHFGARPLSLSLATTDLINKVSDPSIRQLIFELLMQGTVRSIVGGLDSNRIRFITQMSDSPDEYEQGFYHQGDEPPEEVNGAERDPNVLNQICRYEKLAENWYSFIFALAEVKDADRYRLAAWNYLGVDGQKNITTDWSQARVTLVDWQAVGYKEDQTDRAFVVCIQFRDKNVDLLGMLTLYFDPDTLKYVGTELRM